MRYTNLPGTDVEVSKICLGSMTWGQQNTQDEGFAYFAAPRSYCPGGSKIRKTKVLLRWTWL